MRTAPVVLLCLAIPTQVSAKPKHPVVVQVVKRHVLTWSRNPNIGTVSGRLAYVKVFIWRGTIEQAAGANEELYRFIRFTKTRRRSHPASTRDGLTRNLCVLVTK
jgi:hypothetical protein